MKPLRCLAALLFALVVAYALTHGRVACATSFIAWTADMTRAQDSVPPSRPSVKFVTVHRAAGYRVVSYSRVARAGLADTLIPEAIEMPASAEVGTIELKVAAHDDQASLDRLGWRARCVAGTLPKLVSDPVPDAQYMRSASAPRTDPPGWATLYLNFEDWSEAMGAHRDSLHAAVVITCLDRARNESAPSDTIGIDAPAR